MTKLEIEAKGPDELIELFTPAQLAEAMGAPDVRILALASALTANLTLQPWMATLFANLVETQADVDGLRDFIKGTAEKYGLVDGDFSDGFITTWIKSHLLVPGQEQLWKTSFAHKPKLTHVVRALVEFRVLAHKLNTALSSNAELLLQASGRELVTSASWYYGQQGQPLKFPAQLLTSVEPAKVLNAMSEAMPAQEIDYHWSPWAEATAPATAPEPEQAKKPTAKKKAVETSPSGEPTAEEKAAQAQKMLDNIKKMIKAEIQAMLLTNTEVLQGVVTAVFAATPGMLDKAVQKLLAQPAHQNLVQVQVQKAVLEHIKGMDLNSLVAQQVAAQVGSKIDLNKLRKDIADQMLHNSDDYFHQVFDRIVVKDPATDEILGKLHIQAAIKPTAPTLPFKG